MGSVAPAEGTGRAAEALRHAAGEQREGCPESDEQQDGKDGGRHHAAFPRRAPIPRLSATSQAAPNVIVMSATLKVGQ